MFQISKHTLAAMVLAALWLTGCSTVRQPEEQPCTLRVGTSGDYLPFSKFPGHSSNLGSVAGWAGIDITMADRLAYDLGCETKLVRFRWPTLIQQLERGDFDIAMSGITMRPERSLHGRFSRPYARTGVVIITDQATTGPRTLADLNQPSLHFAVNAGGHLERWSRRHLPRATLQTTEDNRRLADLLLDPSVSGIVTDSAESRSWENLGTVHGPFSTDYKAVLIAADRGDLAPRVDRWLVARELDGWLPELRRFHLGEAQAATPYEATAHAVAALIRVRLSIMPMVASTKRSNGSQVTDSGQERKVIDRAKAWAGSAGERAELLFPVLIDMAKLVQHRSTKETDRPNLERLRDGILGVDRQIARELRRLPSASAESWRNLLAPLAQDLPIENDEIRELAEVLKRAAAIRAAPDSPAESP